MNIIIIDDDHLVVESLKTIVSANGIEVLAVGYNGNDAIELYKIHKPDVLLMDIRMEILSGIDAAKSILKEFPDAKILLITTFQDQEYIIEALVIGCKGYILKQNIQGIIPAINAVNSGNMVFDSQIIEDNFRNNSKKELELNIDKNQTSFSEREIDILLLVAEGLNNKEISEKLYLSEGTVRNYVSNLLDKLYLRDRTQLAIYYYKMKYGVV